MLYSVTQPMNINSDEDRIEIYWNPDNDYLFGLIRTWHVRIYTSDHGTFYEVTTFFRHDITKVAEKGINLYRWDHGINQKAETQAQQYSQDLSEWAKKYE